MSFSSFFKFFFMICTFFSLRVQGQYLYPVATLQSNDRPSFLFVVHQKTRTELELWMWDPIENKKIKSLSSRFIPAAFTLLPSQKAFSFIDQGRIRVKRFEKRAPKALDVYEPIYNFGFPCWIDDSTCVVSARKGKRFGIFQIDLQGNVKTIVYSKKTDALYPQKVGDILFYVEQTQNESKIISVSYPQDASVKSIDLDDIDAILDAEKKWKEPLINNEEKKVLHVSLKKKILFLRVYEGELFFLVCEDQEGENKGLVNFFLCYAPQNLPVKRLFSFSLPVNLISHADKASLYESLLPLLPYRHKNNIYFSDWVQRTDGAGLDLFCYNLSDEITIKIVCGAKGEHLFAPIMFGEKFFFGGTQNFSGLSSVDIFS